MALQDLIINLDDFTPYRAITCQIDEIEDLEPWIREAQTFDVQPVIGKELLAEAIEKRFEEEKYEALCQLIVPALVYYSYARFIRNSSVKNTAFGPVVKTNNFSQPATDTAISRQSGDAMNCASAYMDEVICYIKKNIGDFPLYKGEKHEEKRRGGFRIRKIG